MLHIILTILKITGILLLLLVLLVAGFLLVALFVPLRYRVAAVHTPEDTHGEARITWMLHLITVRILFQPIPGESPFARDTLRLRFRILGMEPVRISSFFKEKRKKKKKKRRGRQKEYEGPPEQESVQNRDIRQKPHVQVKPHSQDKLHQQDKLRPQDKPHPQKIPHPQQENRENPRPQESLHTSKKHSAETYQADAEAQEESQGRVRWIVLRLCEVCKRFLNRIRSFCNTIRGIPKRLRSLKRKILKALKTPGELSRRVSDFRDRLEACEADEVVRETYSRLKRLLGHYRIRKGKGYLRFGTGDPALTGELTGLLYMILPVSCGEISLEPQFTETMLETDLVIDGHIRVIHAVTALWWAFRNQRLRSLIRVFRSES